MNRYYGDILSRIAEPPLWFDEHAVPRWCLFSPGELADIYAREAALVLIECQFCRTSFEVAFSSTGAREKGGRKDQLAELIEEGRLHYGDPPNIECCEGGPSANSVPIRVLEYWVRPYLLGEGVEKNAHAGSVINDLTSMKWRRDRSREEPLRAPWDAGH